MLKQKIEMKLPDDTMLIAESDEYSDYPGISINYKDAQGAVERVAFVEYNSAREIGRKLIVGAYKNDSDETKYYEPYQYVVKPSFKELYQVYCDTEKPEYKLFQSNGFYTLIRVSDNSVLFRDFVDENAEIEKHLGHVVSLSAHVGKEGVEKLSILCVNCNEEIYSVKRNTSLNEVFKIKKPRSISDVVKYASNPDEIKKYACIGYSKIDFGQNGMEFNHRWTDKNWMIKTEQFSKIYNELLRDYLCYTILGCVSDVKVFCSESKNAIKVEDKIYATQIVTGDYTFFIVFDLKDELPDIYIYSYINRFLYKNLKPLKLETSSNVDCKATISYVKHLDDYKNPSITYLDEVEDDCWELFKKYAEFVGVKFKEGIDQTISKEISEKIMSLVERTFGVDFPMSKEG